MPFQSSYIAWYNVKHFKPSLKSTHAIDTVVFTCFLRILMNSCGLTSFEFITLAYWWCKFKCICMYTVYYIIIYGVFWVVHTRHFYCLLMQKRKKLLHCITWFKFLADLAKHFDDDGVGDVHDNYTCITPPWKTRN